MFIGCVGIDVSAHDWSTHMNKTKINEYSELILVNFDDGTVISDSTHSYLSENGTAIYADDLGLLEKETFSRFQNAVNFSGIWDPVEAEKAFEYVFEPYEEDGLMMTAYPIPVIPDVYDPSYKPEFLVLHSISSGVYGPVNYLYASIKHETRRLYLLSIGVAVFGMVLMLSIIWCVARCLTRPLLYMEGIAWRIVNHSDPRSSSVMKMIEEVEEKATVRCTPRTEINSLVLEFRTMILSFSGGGASKPSQEKYHEIRNSLTWHSDFQQLYSREEKRPIRSSSIFAASLDLTDEESSQHSSEMVEVAKGVIPRKNALVEPSSEFIVPPPIKRNTDNVICTSMRATDKGCETEKLSKQSQLRVIRSPLFWWILALIVVPLVLLLLLICALVSSRITRTIPSWVKRADRASHALSRQALNLTAGTKASLMTAEVFEATRNLHLVTRVVNGLAFGGITQSDSFTEMDSASEECKSYTPGVCPFFESDRSPCPCEWGDVIAATCTSFNDTQSRYLQTQLWSLQRQTEAFPGSPNATQWYSNYTDLPGFEGDTGGDVYSTSYDRLRVGSASAVVNFPVYNYKRGLGRPNHVIGVYSGFEDGLFLGFDGCQYINAELAHWHSSEDNGAAKVSPSLCPLGKYGYDPRCRGWFVTGREHYMTSGEPLHVTAPYVFAVSGEVATSLTSPIANPRTGAYIGQTLLDHFPESLRHGLRHLPTYQQGTVVPILITLEEDSTGGDTVVGPNLTVGWESAALVDLLFPFDKAGSARRTHFEHEVLSEMKNGTGGMKLFERTGEDGSEEDLIIAFAPVYERLILALSPDDFARGVSVSNSPIYSVGMIRYADDMHLAFQAIQDTILTQLARTRATYIAVTVVDAILFALLSCVVSLQSSCESVPESRSAVCLGVTFPSVTCIPHFSFPCVFHCLQITMCIVKPMIMLLRAVQAVNQNIVRDDDFPPIKGGSREINRVTNSFSKLFKVVRVSNTAFFSGNLKWAYHFVRDALELFRKVEDQKAIAVACGNLGNILVALYLDSGELTTADSDDNLISVALQHYAESIELGEREFNACPESDAKADFALQFSDRLFNRGLFLLLIQGSEDAPTDARERALKDFQLARSLDYDAKDWMMKKKLLFKNSVSYFCRLLRRIHGLAYFYDDIGLREVWDAKELVDFADQLLFAAWNEPTAPLFAELSKAGRLQQLEDAGIQVLGMDNPVEAGRLAMRMLVEDEYLLETSFERAADALLKLLQGTNDSIKFSKRTTSCAREDLRRMMRSCKKSSLDIGKNIVFAVELSSQLGEDPLLEKINTNCLALFERQISTKDYMGLVACRSKESVKLKLAPKEGNEERQRSVLDAATSCSTDRCIYTLPLAIQMIIDSDVSLENDTYIMYILDGSSGDMQAFDSLRLQIDRLNRERSTSIHLFIVGVCVQDQRIKDQCRQLATASKLSMYADATVESIDGIFDSVKTAMTGRATNNGLLKGITMECF